MTLVNIYPGARPSNLFQPRSNDGFAVRGVMAGRAKAYQIVWMIVEFVLINVVNVKMGSPSGSLFSTSLTSPFVSVSNGAGNTLPLWGIFPVGHTTLPRGIVGATNGTRKKKGFALGSDSYTKSFEPIANARWVNPSISSYISAWAFLGDVFSGKPILVSKWFLVPCCSAIFTICRIGTASLPYRFEGNGTNLKARRAGYFGTQYSLIGSIPVVMKGEVYKSLNRFRNFILGKRSGGEMYNRNGNINIASVGIGVDSSFAVGSNSVTRKNVLYRDLATPKHPANLGLGTQLAIRGWGHVETAYFKFFLSVKSAVCMLFSHNENKNPIGLRPALLSRQHGKPMRLINNSTLRDITQERRPNPCCLDTSIIPRIQYKFNEVYTCAY